MAQQDDALGNERRIAWVGFDRRRGPRRHTPEEAPAGAERRHADRRRRRPGLAALLGAILGHRDAG